VVTLFIANIAVQLLHLLGSFSPRIEKRLIRSPQTTQTIVLPERVAMAVVQLKAVVQVQATGLLHPLNVQLLLRLLLHPHRLLLRNLLLPRKSPKIPTTIASLACVPTLIRMRCHQILMMLPLIMTLLMLLPIMLTIFIPSHLVI
jgi:hypothetical protein